MDYTTDKLLEMIKRGILYPASGKTFEDSEILAFCDEQIRAYITQKINASREEFFVYKYEIPLVLNKTKYRVPSRAYGSGTRYIQYQDGGGSVYTLRRYEPNQPEEWPLGYGSPRGFYLESNSIVLLPTPADVTGTLILGVYLRPNKLVPTNEVGVITQIDYVNQTAVFSGPSTIGTDTKCDLIKGTSGFETLKADFYPQVTAQLGPGEYQIEFGFDISDLEIDDYLTLAGETPVPQIPIDLHPWLAQKVKCQILEAIGDTAGFSLASAQLRLIETAASNIVAPRDDGTPKKIIGRWKRFI